MKINYRFIAGYGLSALLSCFLADPVLAGETEVSAKIAPVSYISVKGDAARFREHYWITDGYSGGVEDLSIKSHIDNKTALEFESFGFPENNNYGADLHLEREDVGFFKIDYNTFRKYYDNTGGTFYPINVYENVKLDQDLHIDVGHLGIEIGSTLGNFPESSLFFEQHTKSGQKSRLSWASVVESGYTRMTSPTWQDVQETVNSFGLRSKGQLSGFDVKGEQKWEFVRTRLFREEVYLNTTATSAKRRTHEQTPEADIVSTTLRGEKWLWKDRGFLSLGYRYTKIDNNEGEFIREYDIWGNPRHFSNGHNKIFATSDNKYTSNVLAGNFQNEFTKNLTFTSKLKAEIIGRRGGSRYPSDTTDPPNSIPNTIEVSSNENKSYRYGENFGFRYNGIKYTSLYTEAEFEQTQNWLTENRDSLAFESSSSAGEIFNRETDVYSSKYVLTLGGRTTPSKYLNLSTHIRHRIEDVDYDDQRETAASSSSEKSAFMDFMQVGGTEFTSKWTCKPIKKLNGSIRYQYADNAYVTRTENQVNQRATTVTNTFTYDVAMFPTERFMVDLAYMKQFAKTVTPASNGASPKLPGFTADVDSWMISSSYSLSNKFSLFSIFNKSTQENFNDFSSISLPYGVNAQWYDATMGIKWELTKKVSVEPKYTYYSYKSNDQSEANGDYSAHGVWLGVNLDWF